MLGIVACARDLPPNDSDSSNDEPRHGELGTYDQMPTGERIRSCTHRHHQAGFRSSYDTKEVSASRVTHPMTDLAANLPVVRTGVAS